MTRIIAIFSIIFIVSCTSSRQTAEVGATTETTTASEKLDRSQPPVPGPAPEIRIGDYEFFELDNGLKVYVVRNDKLPRVTYSMQIDLDPLLEKDKTGYVSIMGDLMSRGTATKTKAEIDEAVDFIGASFATFSNGMYGSSLTKHSDKVLEIMRDVLLNPSFPQEELDKLLQLAHSDLASGKDDPGVIINRVRSRVLYGAGHPYGELTTEATLNNITRDDIVAYYNTYWTPRNTYMAVVGDITVGEAKEKVESYFGDWTGKALPEHEYAQPEAPEKTTVILVDRPQSVQSEIRVSYPVDYKTGSVDFFAAKLMNQVLGGGFTSRLMQNLREDKAYTYGAGSGLSTDEIIGRFSAGASVRNEVTDSAVHEFLYEMERIAEDGVQEEELNAEKAYLTGSFARSLESPQTIASFAISTAVNDLPEDFFQTYLQRMNMVTVEEVNAAARKYIKPDNAYIVVVGKADEIEEKLKAFGPVIRYDSDGNKVDRAGMNAALKDITPEEVIARYLEAIGGKEQLQKVDNQRQTWEIEAFGQVMEVRSVKTADGRFLTEVLMGGQVQQSIVSDGSDVVTRTGGSIVEMDGPTKESEILNNRLFPELYYGSGGVELKLTGIEKVDGNNAFAVSILYPSGKESQAYFDMESGLKVKETTTIETPQGSFVQAAKYSDYKEVDGIRYAHVNTVQMGPQNVESRLVSLENNTELEEGTFDLE